MAGPDDRSDDDSLSRRPAQSPRNDKESSAATVQMSTGPQSAVSPQGVTRLWLGQGEETGVTRAGYDADGQLRPAQRRFLDNLKRLRLSVKAVRSEDGAGPGGAAAEWELLHRIGEGGMGVVSAARQASLDRVVALKSCKGAVDSALEAAFLAEAAVLATLEHPNIVPVIELGRTGNGSPFYAMKRVLGRPWSDYFDGTPAEDSLATVDPVTPSVGMGSTSIRRVHRRMLMLHEHLDILLKVCDAIAFAHDRGIVHRDIKPDNVMVGDFGEVLVMD
jgi:serine/threonine protein kinase